MDVLLAICAVTGAALCMGLGAIGSAVGEGFAAFKAVEASTLQPAAADQVMRTMLIGMAVAESPGVFALFIAILLATVDHSGGGLLKAAGLLASGICMGYHKHG